MRSLIVSLLATVITMVAVGAQAGHVSNSYCSESGDVCASARDEGGQRILRISTAANYFDTYMVCVTPRDGARTCRNGTMRDGNGDGVWTGRMSWNARFPNEGPGAYSVRWTSGDAYRSPRLGFHIPR